MREINAGKNEEGQRLDRILVRLFPNAGKGFIFKMLRKKNILLNDRKADGTERLKAGDIIKIFFKEETFLKLSGESAVNGSETLLSEGLGTSSGYRGETDVLKNMIVYEDDDVLVLNKPKGLLSQKAESSDSSLNEMIISHMLYKGEIDQEQLKTFRPSVCNRLDRNTSGLICAGKSLKGLKILSDLFRERKIAKYYLCIVKGEVKEAKRIEGYLKKDEKTNKVNVNVIPQKGFLNGQENEKESFIATGYKPLAFRDGCSLLEVELITGKSHQIRAHLASIGHPIAGDMKYGDKALNRKLKEKYGIKDQMLFCYRMVFPSDCGELYRMNNKEIVLEKPDEFFI